MFVFYFSCDNQRRSCVLPHWHDQETHDDDIWPGCQVQGLTWLHNADRQAWGSRFPLQGCWYVSDLIPETRGLVNVSLSLVSGVNQSGCL